MTLNALFITMSPSTSIDYIDLLKAVNQEE